MCFDLDMINEVRQELGMGPDFASAKRGDFAAAGPMNARLVVEYAWDADRKEFAQ